MAKRVLISTLITNQNRTHDSNIEIIGYEEDGSRYLIIAVESRWFIIESIVVSQKLRRELEVAEQVVWPLSNQDNLRKYEISAKESETKVTLESRLDQEELLYKGTKVEFDEEC